MNDDQKLPYDMLKREVGRRKIEGTNKVEVVFAIRNPMPPYDEHMERIILIEHEEGTNNS